MTCHTPYFSSLGDLEVQYCCCFFYFLFFFCPKVYEIPAPQPGIKPVPASLEGEVLTPGLLGKSLRLIKKKKKKVLQRTEHLSKTNLCYSICQQIWKTQQWPQDWKRSVFIPIPKKDNAKECSNYHTIVLISHASKVMLKILQARLQ